MKISIQHINQGKGLQKWDIIQELECSLSGIDKYDAVAPFESDYSSDRYGSMCRHGPPSLSDIVTLSERLQVPSQHSAALKSSNYIQLTIFGLPQRLVFNWMFHRRRRSPSSRKISSKNEATSEAAVFFYRLNFDPNLTGCSVRP